MDNVVATWITQNINIIIVVLLLLIGGVFKHWIQAVPNKYIPVILLPLGILFAILFHLPIKDSGLIFGYIVEGIASAVAAMVTQSKGKDIIQDLFNKDDFAKNVSDRVDDKVEEELGKLASIDFSDVDKQIDRELGEDSTDTNVDISDAINEVAKD